MRLAVAWEQVPKPDIMATGTLPGGAGEGLSYFGNQDGTRIGTFEVCLRGRDSHVREPRMGVCQRLERLMWGVFCPDLRGLRLDIILGPEEKTKQGVQGVRRRPRRGRIRRRLQQIRRLLVW